METRLWFVRLGMRIAYRMYRMHRMHKHRHPSSRNRLSCFADNRGDCEKIYFAVVAVFRKIRLKL